MILSLSMRSNDEIFITNGSNNLFNGPLSFAAVLDCFPEIMVKTSKATAKRRKIPKASIINVKILPANFDMESSPLYEMYQKRPVKRTSVDPTNDSNTIKSLFFSGLSLLSKFSPCFQF